MSRLLGWLIGTVVALSLVASLPAYAKATKKQFRARVEVNSLCDIQSHGFIGIALTDVDNPNQDLCVSAGYNNADLITIIRGLVGETVEVEGKVSYWGDHPGIPNYIFAFTKVAGTKMSKYKLKSACPTSVYIAASLSGGVSQLPPECGGPQSTGTGAGEESSTTPSSPGASSPTETSAPTTGAPVTSHFIDGIPQCTRTQYESRDASLYVLNTCNTAVTVVMTSDSGNFWGQLDVSPNSHTAATNLGIGYSPRKDGGVYLFTCPRGSQPVLPNGSAWIPKNYKGQYTCSQ
jgi:hypothetical protein